MEAFCCSRAKIDESLNSTKLERKISLFYPSSCSVHARTHAQYTHTHTPAEEMYCKSATLPARWEISSRGSSNLRRAYLWARSCVCTRTRDLASSFHRPARLPRKTMEGIECLLPKRAKPRREPDNTRPMFHGDGFIGNIGAAEIRLGKKQKRRAQKWIPVTSFTCPHCPHCPH